MQGAAICHSLFVRTENSDGKFDHAKKRRHATFCTHDFPHRKNRATQISLSLWFTGIKIVICTLLAGKTVKIIVVF